MLAPDPPVRDPRKATRRAGRFDALDADNSGSIDGKELEVLVQWIWASGEAYGSSPPVLRAPAEEP